MRESSSKGIGFFTKLVLFLIIIAFIFWGVGSFVSFRQGNLIAKVNGLPITIKEFNQYYNYKLYQLRQTFGPLNEEIIKKLNLKKAVLNELITMKVIEKEAKNLGLHVNKKEIVERIKSFSAFQEKGSFSPELYKYVLRELGMTPEFFENLVREDLLKSKLFLFLTTPILVSKDEAKDYLSFVNQNLALEIAYYPLSECKKEVRSNLTQQKLKNYYLAHRDMYLSPPKVKLFYLFISYPQKVAVSEEELKAFYFKNKEMFKEPYRIKLVKIYTKNKTEIKKLYQALSGVKTVKDLEKVFHVKAEWVSLEDLPSDLAELLKDARKGQIIGPLNYRGGVLVLGVEDIRKEKYLPFEKVKRKILKKVKEKKKKEIAYQKALELYKNILKGGEKKRFCKGHIVCNETPYLAKTDLERFFKDEAIEEIFSSGKGAILKPLYGKKGVYVVKILDKREPQVIPFGKVYSKVLRDYIKDTSVKVCESKCYKLLNLFENKTSLEEDFGKIARSLGFKIKEIKVKRSGVSQRFSEDIAEILSQMGKPGVIKKVFHDGESFDVIYLKEIIPPQGNFSQKDLDVARNYLLRIKREHFFERWFNEKMEEAQIKIYRNI